jgi:prepilin peptidase CpaA
MSLSIMLVLILAVLLVTAAIFDLTSFTIPNVLPAAMLLLFGVFMLAITLGGHAVSWNEMSPHLLAGGVGLIAGMALFAAGWVGGGDAKLFAMICLWLGWEAMYQYAIMVSFLGVMLTLGLLMLRRTPLPLFLVKQVWILRRADPQSGVPYGVALSAAALIVLPDTEIFHLAAAR